MAITRQEKQIQWAAANSLSIVAGGTGTSDAVTFDADAVGGAVALKANNDGTPASGDTVDFYAIFSSGDPDGAGTDEYDDTDPTHAMFLGTVDTNTTDPAQIHVPDFPVSAKSYKVHAINNSGGRAITVSAAMYETNAA